VLIVGASGSGKSTLALQLMSMGAALVSDDRTILSPARDGVVATAPTAIAGLIEARGVGLLNAAHLAECRIDLMVDLDHVETARLPEHKTTEILGQRVTMLYKAENSAFAAAILHYLKAGRRSE